MPLIAPISGLKVVVKTFSEYASLPLVKTISVKVPPISTAILYI